MKNFAGYRFLLGPEQLLFEPGRRVSSPAEYLAWHTSVVTGRGGDPWDSPKGAEARVNWGRWVANCAWCGTGMLTRPDWGIACCGECGARYSPDRVRFPERYDTIEKILLRRVRRDQQNWDKRQSVEELEQENQSSEVLTP